MASGDIEEGLEMLAQKRHGIYEAKKDSLRMEIDQLRTFFYSMEKEREVLECELKATQDLCSRKLVKAEKELQNAQQQLCDTRNEVALLLEGKHQEMERLQKERDECQARAGDLAGEFDFFRGYTKYLEEKVCTLVAKLHDYHNDLQTKTEEIVETRSRAVEELEWVKQSMIKFEKNLVEYHKNNQQIPSEKDVAFRIVDEMKLFEASRKSYSRSAELLEEMTVCNGRYHDGSRMDEVLCEKLQKLERDLDCATSRAEAAEARLRQEDITISKLEGLVSTLQDEVHTLKEKNLQYVTEKIEAEAGAQLREAAISVLRLRICALEGDLQKERDLKMAKILPDHNKKGLGLSPDISMEIKGRSEIAIKKDTDIRNVDRVVAKLEAAKHQLQEDAEIIKQLRQTIALLERDLEKERSRNIPTRFNSESWSVNKMKKLEHALVEAHDTYTLLTKDMTELRDRKAPIKTTEATMESQQDHIPLEYAEDEFDNISETSQIVNDFFKENGGQCSSPVPDSYQYSSSGAENYLFNSNGQWSHEEVDFI